MASCQLLNLHIFAFSKSVCDVSTLSPYIHIYIYIYGFSFFVLTTFWAVDRSGSAIFSSRSDFMVCSHYCLMHVKYGCHMSTMLLQLWTTVWLLLRSFGHYYHLTLLTVPRLSEWRHRMACVFKWSDAITLKLSPYIPYLPADIACFLFWNGRWMRRPRQRCSYQPPN